MEKVTIVLDSHEYKNKQSELIDALNFLCQPTFFYSEYDNWITNYFARTPFLNSQLLHLSYWSLSFVYTIKLLVSFNKSDIIIFINPIVGFFYSLLTRVFGSRDSIVIAGFLFEEKENQIYYYLRKCLVNFSYRKVNKIIVYSEIEERKYKQLFPLLQDKFLYVPYGKDYDYSDKLKYKSEHTYVASGGRSNRDYVTLCKAMNLIGKQNSDINLFIATRPECFNQESEFPNVKFLYGITLNMFGSFLEQASFVVLPLLDSDLSAGHMTLFEALSLNKIVLVTDILSVRDYVSENEVIFYKPGDYFDLAAKIIEINNNLENEKYKMKAYKGYNLYCQNYSFKSLLIRIVNSICPSI